MTVGERVRAMTDEQLAELLIRILYSYEETSLMYCDGSQRCIREDGEILCSREAEVRCALRFIKGEVQNDDFLGAN